MRKLNCVKTLVYFCLIVKIFAVPVAQKSENLCPSKLIGNVI